MTLHPLHLAQAQPVGTRPGGSTRGGWERGLCAWVLVLVGLLGAAEPALAQRLLDRSQMPELQGVGIVDKRGTPVPKDLIFTNAQGLPRRLGDFFDGRRPVILVMAYYDCPMLCTLVLNSVQESLNQLSWTAGKQFRIITVSFDHTNTVEQARAKQQLYLAGYDREVDESAWEFLVGDVESARALANAVGFHYRFLPDKDEFSHPSALIVLSPDGVVHNTIEKLKFPSMEVRLALAEAADGKIGTLFERLVHTCFSYNPNTGQYTLAATRVMQVGGGLSILALGSAIAVFARARARRLASDRAVVSGG